MARQKKNAEATVTQPEQYVNVAHFRDIHSYVIARRMIDAAGQKIIKVKGRRMTISIPDMKKKDFSELMKSINMKIQELNAACQASKDYMKVRQSYFQAAKQERTAKFAVIEQLFPKKAS